MIRVEIGLLASIMTLYLGLTPRLGGGRDETGKLGFHIISGHFTPSRWKARRPRRHHVGPGNWATAGEVVLATAGTLRSESYTARTRGGTENAGSNPGGDDFFSFLCAVIPSSLLSLGFHTSERSSQATSDSVPKASQGLT